MKRRPPFVLDRLRHYLKIERKVLDHDGQGGFKETWQLLEHGWGDLQPLLPTPGSEIWRAGEHLFPLRYRALLRAEAPLAPNFRLVWEGKFLYTISCPYSLWDGSYQMVLVERRLS